MIMQLRSQFPFAALFGIATCFISTDLRAQLPGAPPAQPPITVRQTLTGFTADSSAEDIEITVCCESVIHFVAHAAATSGNIPTQPWMLLAAEACPGAHFTVAAIPQQATLATAMLRVELSIELSFTSNASQNTDYYLIFGPETDQIIHQYRNLTAHTPLVLLWAYGLFQAKERYISTQELVDVGGRYRAEHILSRSG